MLIDAHAHLNFPAFKKDLDEVIKRTLENNIWIINVGTNYQSSKRAVEIAAKYKEGVFATVGLHPINLETGLVKIKSEQGEKEIFEKEFEAKKYQELARSEKVVALGEIGLDYYWKPKTRIKKELFKELQADLLKKELSLAKEMGLPVIFHCRMAHQDLIDFLLKNPDLRPEKALAHGFVGNQQELESYLNLGYYIGFNGIIFKKIEGISFEENIKKTPLGKTILETDCPYLSPPEKEGQRNEPLYLKYILKKVSQIKGVDQGELARVTTQNAKTFFGIK
jgi:TatD DNase family protein